MSESKIFPSVGDDTLALSAAVAAAVEKACHASIDQWGKVVATSAKAEVAVTRAFQSVLDTATRVGVPRSEAATIALAGLVVNHPEFKGKVDLEDSRTAREWKRVQKLWSGALMRAHFHAVPFSLDLPDDKEKALPWEEAKKKPAKEAKTIVDLIRDGAPTIGKAADLHVLLAFTIKSCRASGMPNLAAEILDCVKDAIPTFTE